MGMEITLSRGGPDIEPGVYPGTLENVVAKTIDFPPSQFSPEGGPKDMFEWTFDIDGESVTALTTQMTGPKSKTASFIGALLGPQALQPGNTFGVNDLIGKQALITLEENDKGWIAVKGLTALPRQSRRSATRPTVREQVAPAADADDEEGDLPF